MRSGWFHAGQSAESLPLNVQQDDRLTSLTAVIRRQKQLATAIGVELEQQNEILDGVSLNTLALCVRG